MPIPFLRSRSPGVPINPYGVTGMLSNDRDNVRVNHRHENLEQLFVQQIQDVRFKPASLLNHVRHAKSAFGNPNAKPNGLAFLKFHFPNVTISRTRSVLLIRDKRPASLQLYAGTRRPAFLKCR